MQMASSANRTCNALRSASEYTATVRTLSSRHAERMRSAISPRFAIRIFRNISPGGELFLPVRADSEKRFAIFHRLAVLHENPHYFSRHVRLDFIHQLHRFDDAQRLALIHPRT